MLASKCLIINTKNKQTLPQFFNFLVDELGKLRRHHWKENLKISKLAKFESDTS